MKESTSVFIRNICIAFAAMMFGFAINRISHVVERAVELHFSSVIVHEGGE